MKRKSRYDRSLDRISFFNKNVDIYDDSCWGGRDRGERGDIEICLSHSFVYSASTIVLRTCLCRDYRHTSR